MEFHFKGLDKLEKRKRKANVTSYRSCVDSRRVKFEAIGRQ